ncbi:MAG: BRO family protein [Peptostreptococcus sp.]|uniref:ORF6C domain-containing protein n=1 Tax=Peptostreptococcus TaxID=1257 RepID=UPI002901F1BD|nr:MULTISPECIES: ORF6C domain-containing protein [Peptostreptococcus]MDU1264470.1 BRO family protein [Peptostreptococcus sp.]MDU5095424.1 BRO family protein [Peptostreptococcus anaerobius]
MNNELMRFENEEFGEVRSVLIDDEPWFVGKDVASALGYSNYRDALNKHVESEDKGVAKCDTLGGNQDMSVINESGLYSLIFGSKLESAKKFKKWVTSEVLPSIRKHGFYMQDGLSREVQAIFHLDRQQQKLIKEISDINNSVTEFKEHMPLFAVECDCLNKEVKKRATECLGGYRSDAYNDKSLRSRVFADIYSEIRRQFGVTSYKGIRRVQYDKAVELVRGHKLPLLLSEDIQDVLNS